jgi:hypothetical protein
MRSLLTRRVESLSSRCGTVSLREMTGKESARLLSKGCGQKANVDYKETWAPVAKLVTLRIFLTPVAILLLHTLQMNIKTAFLNADLEEMDFVKPLYYQFWILKLLYDSLKDFAMRSKNAHQINLLKQGGVLRLKKAI